MSAKYMNRFSLTTPLGAHANSAASSAAQWSKTRHEIVLGPFAFPNAHRDVKQCHQDEKTRFLFLRRFSHHFLNCAFLQARVSLFIMRSLCHSAAIGSRVRYTCAASQSVLESIPAYTTKNAGRTAADGYVNVDDDDDYFCDDKLLELKFTLTRQSRAQTAEMAKTVPLLIRLACFISNSLHSLISLFVQVANHRLAENDNLVKGYWRRIYWRQECDFYELHTKTVKCFNSRKKAPV